jgi:hypothetical protein
MRTAVIILAGGAAVELVGHTPVGRLVGALVRELVRVAL